MPLVTFEMNTIVPAIEYNSTHQSSYVSFLLALLEIEYRSIILSASNYLSLVSE